mmetsp:Transcript_38482/g.115423  ORF Transcript_38482/g.115423 Transcript_38482/m.115423 type:complete len:380 (+) Transcript_38482:1847-2986(+)
MVQCQGAEVGPRPRGGEGWKEAAGIRVRGRRVELVDDPDVDAVGVEGRGQQGHHGGMSLRIAVRWYRDEDTRTSFPLRTVVVAVGGGPTRRRGQGQGRWGRGRPRYDGSGSPLRRFLDRQSRVRRRTNLVPPRRSSRGCGIADYIPLVSPRRSADDVAAAADDAAVEPDGDRRTLPPPAGENLVLHHVGPEYDEAVGVRHDVVEFVFVRPLPPGGAVVGRSTTFQRRPRGRRQRRFPREIHPQASPVSVFVPVVVGQVVHGRDDSAGGLGGPVDYFRGGAAARARIATKIRLRVIARFPSPPRRGPRLSAVASVAASACYLDGREPILPSGRLVVALRFAPRPRVAMTDVPTEGRGRAVQCNRVVRAKIRTEPGRVDSF